MVPTEPAPLSPDTFVLAHAGPDPSRVPTFVAVIGNPMPAQLALYDSRGHLIATMELKTGPGRYESKLGSDENPLPAGIYCLKLTQGGRSQELSIEVVH